VIFEVATVALLKDVVLCHSVCSSNIVKDHNAFISGSSSLWSCSTSGTWHPATPSRILQRSALLRRMKLQQCYQLWVQ